MSTVFWSGYRVTKEDLFSGLLYLLTKDLKSVNRFIGPLISNEDDAPNAGHDGPIIRGCYAGVSRKEPIGI